MKVALLSFHNAYNYGACLQAYALQEAVRELGADCEYIDYVNGTRAGIYKISARIGKAIKQKNIKDLVKTVGGAPFIRSRRTKFDRFYRERLKKTGQTYRSCDEARSLEGAYDKFVVGSDQVWNAEHNGADAAFLLGFVNDSAKKISYSSSFGMAEIPDAQKAWYAEHLNTIGCLSTREQAGVRIIRELTGRDAHLVLDPVFLPDASHWKSLLTDKKPEKPYTFYYMNAAFDYQNIERVTGIKDKERHILSASVNPSDFLKRNQKVTFAMSPDGFLQKIHDAELVVTTSFHCLAFSIIFRKKFIAILSGDKGRDERLLNLLKITGLESRIFSREMTKADVEAEIDYDEAERRLNVYCDYSKAFLKAALFEGADQADSLKEPALPASEKFEICHQDDCSGCGACSLRCPKHAIEMKPDVEGFLRPVINERLCIRCGVCQRTCQHNAAVPQNQNQQYYAFKQTDAIRAASSSGGAFRTLARQIIADGGVVIASEMNEDWTMAHSVATNDAEVERQGKTYYVQGKAYPRFREAEEYLKNGRKVLFAGTPCQIGGLMKYLGRDDENLITCDIICHGIPSPKVFGTYIDYLKGRGELTQLQHRDKEIGWKGYCVSAVIDGKKVKNKPWLKAYNVMFSHGLINRPSCYQCPYASYHRPSDLTIGDYWGVENHRRELADRLGVSLVLVNTEKGGDFFRNACGDLPLVTLNQKETEQNSLLHPQKKPGRRLGCMLMTERSFEQAAKKYGEWSLKGSLKEAIRRLMLRVKGI
ncbi:polysaccharide pyruvyl transferase family protein [Ruminococcus sp.]|uniref:polysaccharide pyruvyl transferase family protein n=1 Tax=Ruminococcus sp. TaxID=41978 RepID=UPI00388F3E94